MGGKTGKILVLLFASQTNLRLCLSIVGSTLAENLERLRKRGVGVVLREKIMQGPGFPTNDWDNLHNRRQHHLCTFIFQCLKGLVPTERLCARASFMCFFFSKDNRTVILTRQDFLPDRTADGDLLFGFRGSFSSYVKFGSRHEDSSRFCR